MSDIPNWMQRRDEMARIANSKDGTSKIDFKEGYNACRTEMQSELAAARAEISELKEEYDKAWRSLIAKQVEIDRLKTTNIYLQKCVSEFSVENDEYVMAIKTTRNTASDKIEKLNAVISDMKNALKWYSSTGNCACSKEPWHNDIELCPAHKALSEAAKIMESK